MGREEKPNQKNETRISGSLLSIQGAIARFAHLILARLPHERLVSQPAQAAAAVQTAQRVPHESQQHRLASRARLRRLRLGGELRAEEVVDLQMQVRINAGRRWPGGQTDADR